MTPVVAVVAMGEMGAGLAELMVGAGARVRTCLNGRSKASFDRARRAGVEIVDSDAELCDGANFLLSVVPPAAAEETAERYASVLGAMADRPVYVDCNAVSPDTLGKVASIIGPTGAGFADACLLGNAPAPGRPDPRMFLSGAAATKVMALSEYGLTVQDLGGDAGQASALKCAYAALGKGLIAIAAWSIIGAHQNNLTEVFAKEVAQYQPQLAKMLAKALPDMFPKSYRWVAEMQEIGGFLAHVPGAEAGFENISGFFDAISRAEESGDPTKLTAGIEAFLLAEAITELTATPT